ncbi:MAG: succinylglutamate desuccinylase [Deltaproteobacteria bacterium]|nr:succinylglutamate desuccinylase [Deltaproteobacteria bacterium]
MTADIEKQLSRFDDFFTDSGSNLNQQVAFERLTDYAWLVKPRRTGVSLPKGKDIGLVLMGITHGNEWAGAAVINDTLAHIAAGSINLDIPVAFVLGNPRAARQNKRFVDRDLNRSFARHDASTLEDRRALELMPILERTAYILDFHQTTRRSDRPFFIFPHSAKSHAFARQIMPRLTIVTHWGKPFSAEGMCTDEFVNSRGGTGISIELGQNGLDSYQIAVGVDAAIWSIRAAALNCAGDVDALAARTRLATPEIYTWASTLPWPEAGFVDLVEGLDNFRSVELGERLGAVDDRPLLAPAAGRILFPKYLTRQQQSQQSSRPTEVLRIMRQITGADLPP